MTTSLVAVKSDKTDLMPSPSEWAILKEQSSMLVRSGFLPKAVDTPEKAMAIALKGRELGIPPMQSFAHINVIQGKPCISAELMLALIYRNVPGTKIEFTRYEADGCHILATRPAHKPALFKFDQADAKAADLLGKDNWKKYPRAMFRSRCISEMARSQFPDAIMGCSYTPEELGATVNEDGEVINVTPEPRKPEAPPRTEPEPAEHHSPARMDEADPAQGHAPRPAARSPGGKVLYQGDADEQRLLAAVLRGKKVPEEFWEDIGRRLVGKSLSDADDVIQAVREGTV